MTKGEIVQELRARGFGAGKAAVEAALAYTEKKNPVAATVAVKATAVKVEAVTA
jgi:hypothetical protein